MYSANCYDFAARSTTDKWKLMRKTRPFQLRLVGRKFVIYWTFRKVKFILQTVSHLWINSYEKRTKRNTSGRRPETDQKQFSFHLSLINLSYVYHKCEAKEGVFLSYLMLSWIQDFYFHVKVAPHSLIKEFFSCPLTQNLRIGFDSNFRSCNGFTHIR